MAEAAYIALFAAVIIGACLLVPLLRIRSLLIIILGLTSIALELRGLLTLSFYRVVRLESAPIIKARSSPTLFIISVLFLLLAQIVFFSIFNLSSFRDKLFLKGRNFALLLYGLLNLRL